MTTLGRKSLIATFAVTTTAAIAVMHWTSSRRPESQAGTIHVG
jgi:hypothetical protein